MRRDWFGYDPKTRTLYHAFGLKPSDGGVVEQWRVSGWLEASRIIMTGFLHVQSGQPDKIPSEYICQQAWERAAKRLPTGRWVVTYQNIATAVFKHQSWWHSLYEPNREEAPIALVAPKVDPRTLYVPIRPDEKMAIRKGAENATDPIAV